MARSIAKKYLYFYDADREKLILSAHIVHGFLDKSCVGILCVRLLPCDEDR